MFSLNSQNTQLSFNPRAHAGRDCAFDYSFWICVCFNPRAHAGRDYEASIRLI